MWSMQGDLCGLLKTGLVGVEEGVERFLERCHRLGRRNFILMHDVACDMRGKSWLRIVRVEVRRELVGKVSSEKLVKSSKECKK